MAKSAKRKAMKEKIERLKREGNPPGESRYGRKRAYLNQYGGSGDMYPAPKPWK